MASYRDWIGCGRGRAGLLFLSVQAAFHLLHFPPDLSTLLNSADPLFSSSFLSFSFFSLSHSSPFPALLTPLHFPRAPRLPLSSPHLHFSSCPLFPALSPRSPPPLPPRVPLPLFCSLRCFAPFPFLCVHQQSTDAPHFLHFNAPV